MTVPAITKAFMVAALISVACHVAAITAHIAGRKGLLWDIVWGIGVAAMTAAAVWMATYMIAWR